jgi:hypothetical protein
LPDFAAAGTYVLAGDATDLPARLVLQIQGHHDRNEVGGWAAAVRLDGDPTSDLVLMRNGAVLAQEGELIPSLSPLVAPWPLAEIGPLRLANSGHVVWQALRVAGGLGGGTFLYDGVPFLQAGVSVVDGETVTSFVPRTNNFELSPDGRHWLVRVVLSGTTEAFVRVDFGASEPRPGCLGNPGSLRHAAGFVLPDAALELELAATAPLGALVRLHLSTGGPDGLLDCGTPLPYGELLVTSAGRVGALLVGTHAGAPLTLSTALPASLALVNQRFFAQGSYVAPGSILLTNGLRLEVGAP